MKTKKWFWGLFFLLAAVFVIASQTESFAEIGFVGTLATVLLVAVVILGVLNRNFFGIFIPIAFLYIIYEQPLGLYHISPWILISAALLATIGFSILFRDHPKSVVFSGSGAKHFNKAGKITDDNNPYAAVSFGASVQHLRGNSLKTGYFKASFGALEVYFDQSQLSQDGAEIYLECSFGSIELFIPKQWLVKDNIHASFSSVENNSASTVTGEGMPTLLLTGNVNFGSVEVHYV